MKRHILVIITGLFALAGLIDSVLIHLKEINSLSDKTAFAGCNLSGFINCETVAQSQYSHILGMPVSLLGICFYMGICVACVALYTEWHPPIWLYWGITIAILLSFFFAVYLFVMSYYFIHALCPYCLVSDAAATGILIAWLTHAWPHLTGKELHAAV
jgi:uncharacterized membrane protein